MSSTIKLVVHEFPNEMLINGFGSSNFFWNVDVVRKWAPSLEIILRPNVLIGRIELKRLLIEHIMSYQTIFVSSLYDN